MSDNRATDRETRTTSSGVQWVIAATFAAALVLPISLGSHHRTAHTTNGRIMGAIFFGVFVAAITRGVMAALAPIGRGRMVGSRLATRHSRGWTLKYAACA